MQNSITQFACNNFSRTFGESRKVYASISDVTVSVIDSEQSPSLNYFRSLYGAAYGKRGLPTRNVIQNTKWYKYFKMGNDDKSVAREPLRNIRSRKCRRYLSPPDAPPVSLFIDPPPLDFYLGRPLIFRAFNFRSLDRDTLNDRRCDDDRWMNRAPALFRHQRAK